MRLQFLGANEEVTGSCTLVQVDGLNILVDYGLFQDSSKPIEEVYKINKRELPIHISEIDHVLITHIHADHSSKIGMLAAHGFTGSVLCTALTAELMDISLRDSAHIMDRECEQINKRRKVNKLTPLYTVRHVDMIMGSIRGYDYNQEVKLSDRVAVTFLPAGHVCGSAMIYLEYQESEHIKKRVLFSGDTSGKREKPFTMPANLEKLKIDLIISESTYGGRLHSKENPIDKLEKCVRETVYQNGKTILIPIFSIARSTEVLYLLKKIFDNNPEFEDIPIFLASPMACQSHRILGKSDSFNFYDKKWELEKDLFEWDRVSYIEDFKTVQSKLANGHRKIILASSGMVTGGYSTYLASIFLPNKGSKLLFCGYQGIGTLGRKILDKEQKTINIGGKPVKLKADIDFLEGMSSHGDFEELIDLYSDIEKKKLKKIVINHGELEQSKEFAKRLKREFPTVEIIIPKYKQIVKV